MMHALSLLATYYSKKKFKYSQRTDCHSLVSNSHVTAKFKCFIIASRNKHHTIGLFIAESISEVCQL